MGDLRLPMARKGSGIRGITLTFTYHSSDKGAEMKSGCFNRRPLDRKHGYWCYVREYFPDGNFMMTYQYVEDTLSKVCRQTGVLINGQWTELEDCAGCTAERDEVFINGQRAAYEAALQSSRLHGALCAGASSGVRT